jgi:hypothetical protein
MLTPQERHRDAGIVPCMPRFALAGLPLLRRSCRSLRVLRFRANPDSSIGKNFDEGAALRVGNFFEGVDVKADTVAPLVKVMFILATNAL